MLSVLFKWETLVLRRHVLEDKALHILPIGHHLGTKRMMYGGTEVIADTYLLLQGHQLVPMLHGFLLASTNKGIDGNRGKACCIIARGVDLQMQVRNGKVLFDLVLTVHIDNLAEDAKRALDVFCLLCLALHGDANDDVGPHLAGNVGRIVVLQATVNQHHVAQPDGSKGSRNGHRSTHGLWQPAAVEVNLAVVDDVRRHTGKRNLQVLREVERVGIARTELTKELCKVLALDDATFAGLVLLAERKSCGKDISVLLAAVVKALVAKVLLIGNDIAPVLFAHHRVERVGIVTDGIQAAYDAAHRCAGNDIDRNASALQDLQHTNMCHSLCSATTQDNTHLLPAWNAVLLSKHCATRQHQQSQKQKRVLHNCEL